MASDSLVRIIDSQRKPHNGPSETIIVRKEDNGEDGVINWNSGITGPKQYQIKKQKDMEAALPGWDNYRLIIIINLISDRKVAGCN